MKCGFCGGRAERKKVINELEDEMEKWLDDLPKNRKVNAIEFALFFERFRENQWKQDAI